ncbi:hypothetical protein ACFL0O_02750 [Thermodesulfobacteriota bacterium]
MEQIIMCGIFGFAISSETKYDPENIKSLSDQLFLLSASRGKEASGFGILYDGIVEVYRKPAPSNEMVRSAEYRNLFNNLIQQSTRHKNKTPVALIGHSRLATSGFHGLNINNQPINTEKTIGVHNGVIANYSEILLEEPDIHCKTDNDSEVVFRLLQKYLDSGLSIGSAVSRLFGRLEGSASVAAFMPGYSHLLLASNHGSLFYVPDKKNEMMVFASEKYILQKTMREFTPATEYHAQNIRQVHAGEAYLIDLNASPEAVCVLKNEASFKTPNIALNLSEHRVFDSLVTEQEQRENIRRCTRCLLTENMPFIRFDAGGLCNYCQKYKKISLQPRSELEAVLNQHRSRDGSPECIAGLSGGRDSSYALHLLCGELGMKVIAYTYDWGMVNDLARRNQARMVGKLGVEHIIIAADIQKKLTHIRKNIQAWMRRPDLGMIPIFMAGDKHFFIYLNRLHQQTNIKLSIWANNRYEKVQFKYGFAGVYQEDPTTVRIQTPFLNKAKLATYYLKNFMLNPAYFNRSIPDTLSGFYSYYFAKQDMINLYDYIQWDEETILQTLRSEYNWETASDTVSTWRIGDGTAAFYNFIYYTVAGFTENDVFRSNQIREGMISRDEALRIVELENRPRYDAILEYCHTVGVDFNDVLRVIESIPKLYIKKASSK